MCALLFLLTSHVHGQNINVEISVYDSLKYNRQIYFGIDIHNNSKEKLKLKYRSLGNIGFTDTLFNQVASYIIFAHNVFKNKGFLSRTYGRISGKAIILPGDSIKCSVQYYLTNEYLIDKSKIYYKPVFKYNKSEEIIITM